MLRDRRLGDAEFALNNLDQFARGALASRKQLKNATSNWVAENVKGVHRSWIALGFISVERCCPACHASGGIWAGS